MFLWFSFRRVDWLTGHLLFFSSKRFFVTTFERHQTQLQVLDELKATIEKDGFFYRQDLREGENKSLLTPSNDTV